MNEYQLESSERPEYVAASCSKLLDDLGVVFDRIQTGHCPASVDRVDEVHTATRQWFDVAQVESSALRLREQ
jgi:hypothetical protein